MIPIIDKFKGFTREFYTKHPEMTRSAGVSLLLMPTGFALLCFAVLVVGITPWVANVLVGLVMNPLGFWAQRRFGFRSEVHCGEGFTLWMAKVGVTSSSSASAFTFLVEVWGMPFGVARWILNFTVGPVSYVYNKLIVFRGRNPLMALLRPLVRVATYGWLIMMLWSRKKYREVTA